MGHQKPNRHQGEGFKTEKEKARRKSVTPKHHQARLLSRLLLFWSILHMTAVMRCGPCVQYQNKAVYLIDFYMDHQPVSVLTFCQVHVVLALVISVISSSQSLFLNLKHGM